jgi:hypothetical protein
VNACATDCLLQKSLSRLGFTLLPIFFVVCTADTVDESKSLPGQSQLDALRSVGHYVRDPAPLKARQLRSFEILTAYPTFLHPVMRHYFTPRAM